MNKLESFKQLSELLPLEQKFSLYELFTQNPEAGMDCIIHLADEHGLKLNKAEIAQLIRHIDTEGQFNDVDYPAIASNKKLS